MAWAGFDLGTTNSAAAIYDGKAPRMIELKDGSFVLPSVVTLREDGDPLIGAEAIKAGRTNPEYCYRHFKRLIGVKWHPEEEQGYQTVEGPDGYVAFAGPLGEIVTPVQLTALVLAELLVATRDRLEDEWPTGAVICAPADFMQHQKDLIAEAGHMAFAYVLDDQVANGSLTVDDADRMKAAFRVHIEHEPTAAAISYGYDQGKARRIAVFDLGGGTFDISIISAGRRTVDVLATNGIRDVGGADFDRRIADYVLTLWRTDPTHVSDLGLRDSAMSLILMEAEDVKKRLSSADKTTFEVQEIDKAPDGTDLHMKYPVTQATLIELTRDLQDRLIRALESAVDRVRRVDHNFTTADIDDVVLVGGMTRMPAIKALVAKFFNRKPKITGTPEHVVALGAAMKAAQLEGRYPGLTVLDITSHALSLEHSGDVAALLFEQGTQYPTLANFVLTNDTVGQRILSIRVLEGEGMKASVNRVLARAKIELPEPAGDPGTARVPVTAKLDETGRFCLLTGDRVLVGGPG